MTRCQPETATYLELGGEQVYAVEYGGEAPVAQVLLCGPFPSDRLFSLAVWAKWARFLTGFGIGAVRFDYRGTGESTGQFADLDFGEWLEDVCQMCQRLTASSRDRPVILHGMGMGALLAQKAFAKGLGDGLLMWSSPPSALEILKQGLVIRLSMDMVLFTPSERKTAAQYIAELKAGQTVDVDGYPWSGRLWNSAEGMMLDEAFLPGAGEQMPGRPWKHLALTENLAPLVRSTRVFRAMNPRAALLPNTPLNPDLSGFFKENAIWLRAAAGQAQRRTCCA